MYLHIGSNQMIKLEDIVAIVNLKGIQNDSRKKSRKVLDNITGNKRIHNVLKDKDSDLNSLIVTEQGFYTSSISSKTLLERSKR
ncbi:MAG: DUF370 domain-containing protein [Peptococcaceae bacterium]|nr:DUF370 domain-containing protein [Peptococcaceae bacterium]